MQPLDVAFQAGESGMILIFHFYRGSWIWSIYSQGIHVESTHEGLSRVLSSSMQL